MIVNKEVFAMDAHLRELAMELLRGGYDLHTHTSPSHAERSLDDFMLLREAEEYGMAGVMIKNHYEPTEARAELANLYAGTGFSAKAYGSVSLNWPVGGLNPYAAASSLKLGGKIVWMPTRDSANSLLYGNMNGDFFDRPGISVFDEGGKLLPVVFDIMEIVKRHNAYLATGHLGLEETVTLCKAGRKEGVDMILTHPDWFRTVVPVEIQEDLAKMGVLIEKQWNTIADGHITPEAVIGSIRKIGPCNIILTTDRGASGKEHPAEGMLNFVAFLFEKGISKTDIHLMLCKNPEAVVKS
jgi:hypothetical protein